MQYKAIILNFIAMIQYIDVIKLLDIKLVVYYLYNRGKIEILLCSVALYKLQSSK